MAKTRDKPKTAVKAQDRTTARIYSALKDYFPDIPVDPTAVVYRYNPVCIRVRVVSSKFVGKTSDERDAMIQAAYEPLPPDATDDVTMELALTPRESKQSFQLVSREFDEIDVV